MIFKRLGQIIDKFNTKYADNRKCYSNLKKNDKSNSFKLIYHSVFPEHSPLVEGRGKKVKKFKIKKKFKKFLIPLLIAYKLKFFALIPILIGGLVLLVGSTGMAGFFFALFAAVISLKGGHH